MSIKSLDKCYKEGVLLITIDVLSLAFRYSINVKIKLMI